MAKVRIYQWAKVNNLSTVTVIKKLKANKINSKQASSLIDEEILEKVVLNKKGILEKKLKKKANYRRNLYNDRLNRGYFCLDDIFEELSLESVLSEEIKMAVGIEVSKKFKKTRGFNGEYLINLYRDDIKEDVFELVNSLV